MKKLISALLVATVGIFASTGAFAATALAAGTPATVTPTDCTLLSENVTVNLSANVSGAYECYEDLTDIRIATCHKAGSRKGATADCIYTNCDVNGDNCNANDNSCGTSQPAAGAATPTFNYVDYTAYVASSTGGSVAKSQLGGSCTDDGSQAAGLSFFN